MRAAKIITTVIAVLWALYLSYQVYLIRAEVRETCSNTVEMENRLALGKPPGFDSDVHTFRCP